MNIASIIFCFFIALCFRNNISLAQNNRGTLPDTVQQHIIYLTFDDGPLNGSEVINDIVLEEKVNVNVFIVGKNQMVTPMKQSYDLYLQNPYIEIGNHSYSHANGRYKKFYKAPQKVLADFLKCQEVLNLSHKLARLPGRNQWRLSDTSINDIQSGSTSADLLFKEGFTVFGWDMIWYDNSDTSASEQSVNAMIVKMETLLKKGKTVRKNHLILLLHDQIFRKKCSQCELKDLIKRLKAKGNYTFEHLSKYPD